MRRDASATSISLVAALTMLLTGCTSGEGARLNCDKPLLGSISYGGPSGPSYELARTSIALDGNEVTYTHTGSDHSQGAPAIREIVLSGPVRDTATMCEAINAVPAADWRREERVADAHGLYLEVRTGNREFQSEAYPITTSTGGITQAANTLNPEVYERLMTELATWEE